MVVFESCSDVRAVVGEEGRVRGAEVTASGVVAEVVDAHLSE